MSVLMFKCDVYSTIIKATVTETELRLNSRLTEGFGADIIILYFCIYKHHCSILGRHLLMIYKSIYKI